MTEPREGLATAALTIGERLEADHTARRMQAEYTAPDGSVWRIVIEQLEA